MSIKTVLFFITICSICSISLTNKYICRESSGYIIPSNLGKGRIIPVNEDYWKNNLYPQLNGLPIAQDSDNEEYIFGPDANLIDENGNSIVLGDYQKFDENQYDELADYIETDDLFVDNEVELLKSQKTSGEKEFMDDIDLLDPYGDIDVHLSEEEIKELEDKILAPIEPKQLDSKTNEESEENIENLNIEENTSETKNEIISTEDHENTDIFDN